MLTTSIFLEEESCSNKLSFGGGRDYSVGFWILKDSTRSTGWRWRKGEAHLQPLLLDLYAIPTQLPLCLSNSGTGTGMPVNTDTLLEVERSVRRGSTMNTISPLKSWLCLLRSQTNNTTIVLPVFLPRHILLWLCTGNDKQQIFQTDTHRAFVKDKEAKAVCFGCAFKLSGLYVAPLMMFCHSIGLILPI